MSPGTALIEGNNSLGAVVGNYAMGVAIAKAKETGVGWVVAGVVVVVVIGVVKLVGVVVIWGWPLPRRRRIIFILFIIVVVILNSPSLQ